MAVLLTILKVLGTILLVLLGILLIAVLLVLFVPVRYDCSGEIRDPEGSEEMLHLDLDRDASLALDARWLLGAVHATAVAGGGAKGLELDLRLFGFRIPLEKLKGRGKKEETEKEKPSEPKPEKSLEERIDQILNRIERTWERLEDALYVLGTSCGIRAREVVASKLWKLVEAVLPARWGLTGVLGFGDPARSAGVLAAQGYLYPVTAGHVRIDTDYELYRYDLAGAASGSFRLASFVSAGLGIILSKDVRKVIRRLRRGPYPSNRNGNRNHRGHRGSKRCSAA